MRARLLAKQRIHRPPTVQPNGNSVLFKKLQEVENCLRSDEGVAYVQRRRRIPRRNHREDGEKPLAAVLHAVRKAGWAQHELARRACAVLVAHREEAFAAEHKVELVLLRVIMQRLRLTRLQAVHTRQHARVLEE